MVGQQFKLNLPYQREIGDFKKLAQHLNVRFAAMLVANCLCPKSKHAYIWNKNLPLKIHGKFRNIELLIQVFRYYFPAPLSRQNL
jgi:hypothetical protein